MKIKPLIFFAAVLTAACMITAACGDGTGVLVSAGEDWSWESGAVNIIEGSLSLSEYSGRELTIQVTTDLPYGSEEEEQAGRPVFVTFDGSRIAMKKQSDTTRRTPSAENPETEFSARFTLPEKQRVYRIGFLFTVTDENGQELKTFAAEIGGGQGGTGSVFYIQADIARITIIIAAAAFAVWAMALIRTAYYRKKKKQEN